MAHTDTCKTEVTQLVKRKTDSGMAVREACKEAEVETDGIPAETIRSWVYGLQKKEEEGEDRVVENSTIDENVDVTSQANNETPNNQDSKHGGNRKGAGRKVSQKTAWGKVERILKELTEYMKTRCETGPGISKLSKSNIRAYINLLNSFNDDL